MLVYLGVIDVLLKSGQTVPGEFCPGTPGEVVYMKDYFTEVSKHNNRSPVPINTSTEVRVNTTSTSTSAAGPSMTSTPHQSGYVSGMFGAPTRRRQPPNVAFVTHMSREVGLSSSSVRPNSPASGESADMSMSSDIIMLP